MPQSSRPRIVPVTPAFNPNESSVTQDQIDPMKLVQELLNPAPSPTVQNLSAMDKIGSIIGAISQGAAVGLSQDPGRALQQQLQQQQQMKFQAAEAQKERDERIATMNRQFGLQVLGGQIQEQQQIRQEDRAEKRNQTARKNTMDDYIQKNQIEFDFGTKRDKSRAELEKADAILKHSWDVEKQHNQEYQFWYQQNRLENKELFDQKIRLITSGIPAGKANTIANKMFYAEDLTEEEAKTITSAAQRQIRLASRGSGGGGGRGGLSDKQESQYFAARMKDNFVVIEVPVLGDDGKPVIDPKTNQPLKQEQIVEMSNAPKDPLRGTIIGMKRIASDGEKLKKLADEADGLQALRNPGVREMLRTGRVQPNIQGGQEQLKISSYRRQVEQFRNQGATPEELAESLLQRKKEKPEDASAIDAVLTTLPKRKGNFYAEPKTNNSLFPFGEIKGNINQDEINRFQKKWPNKTPK